MSRYIALVKSALFELMRSTVYFNNQFVFLSWIAPYILTIFVSLLIIKKSHFGISIYIANTLAISSVIFVLVFVQNIIASLLFIAAISTTFALNEFFCVTSLFDFGDISQNKALLYKLGFMVHILGLYIGKNLLIFSKMPATISVEYIVIICICLATIILPFLRMQITRVSDNSIFRINPINLTTSTEIQAERVSNTNVSVKTYSVTQKTIDKYSPLLTKRESEVFELLIKGYPYDLISNDLYITNNTLKKHVQSIYNKLGIHNKKELFGLIDKKS